MRTGGGEDRGDGEERANESSGRGGRGADDRALGQTRPCGRLGGERIFVAAAATRARRGFGEFLPLLWLCTETVTITTKSLCRNNRKYIFMILLGYF